MNGMNGFLPLIRADQTGAKLTTEGFEQQQEVRRDAAAWRDS